jgi:serpin B
MANSLWGQIGYSFRPEFLDMIGQNYGAGLRLVNFIDKGERERSRTAINDWVSEKTEGKIEDLIRKDILSNQTRLVLANAIYFKADWLKPFRNGTRNDEFVLLDGSTVTVPMMSRRASTRFAEGAGYQVVALPYKGERMEMIVVLPEQGQFTAIERSLDNEFLNQALTRLAAGDVKLFMPKFEYEARLSLGETLIEMGMPDAFDHQLADFSGMDGTDRLAIAHVEHKAFVAVDEEGTEAAAATAVIAEVESMPVVVRVDRPFLFLIRDVDTGTILFVGRVVDPQ